jgi:hypothetical protein
VSIFKSIILTHNFDLFRTIQSRILANQKWKKSLIAERDLSGINLYEAGARKVTEPFSEWKKKMGSEISALIPSIPFVRNIIEFKDGSSSSDYMLLTHVLHYKEADVTTGTKATRDITIRDLEPALRSVISTDSFIHSNMDDKVLDIIKREARSVRQKNITAIDLSDKLILAIAMRVTSEEYMWLKVTDKTPVREMGRLYQRYKDEFDGDIAHDAAIKTLGEVNIMTPENIHLNSFMYEPILDMGGDNLKGLHDSVVLLGVTK